MSPDLFFQGNLWIHIIIGTVALVVAPGAMLARKGGRWHRRWGKTYFWAMAVVALTAVVMSLMRSGLFLLLVAVFSFYLAFTGYRALYRKRPHDPVALMDGIVAGASLLGGVGLTVYGGWLSASGDGFGAVALAFGALSAGFAGTDLWRFMRPSAAKRAWFFLHMTRMLGAYIATVSAFSAVNFTFLPPVVRWLWPTVVGSIGIALWVRYYRKRFARPTAAVAT